MQKQEKEILELIRNRLSKNGGERVRRIILYGSRARGTASEESDYDILVIETDPVNKREEMRCLRNLFRDLSVPMDIRVMGEIEFEETKDVIGGLAFPANKYGVVLT
ncbi:TPA: nucleotidyltransferase domain-containing protein [Candidatus Acetothermia bacterium]|nr:nucleotidyltransferase domain-containing protein [Candidatus Acetothermia bacterium]